MKKEYLTIYLKPTEQCNLSCLHCYNSVGDTKSTLDLGRLQKFLVSMAGYYSKLDRDLSLEIVFHGGEPFLVGTDVLGQIMDLIKFSLPFADVAFSAQTNLTILKDSEIKFIKNRLDGIIGTSYSPNLRFTGQDQYMEEIWYDNLIKALSQDIRLYFVITLCKEYIENISPMELLDFLIVYNTYNFHIEPLTKNGNSISNWDKIAVSSEEYDSWKAEFTRLFINSKLYRNMPRSIIADKAKTFFDKEFVGCACRDCMLKTLTINADGTIGTCPNVSKQTIIGTLDDPFTNVMCSTLRSQLIISERLRRQECLNCSFFQVCNGGCMQTTGCYEGKKFYGVLEEALSTDKEFNEYIKSYERTTVFH